MNRFRPFCQVHNDQLRATKATNGPTADLVPEHLFVYSATRGDGITVPARAVLITELKREGMNMSVVTAIERLLVFLRAGQRDRQARQALRRDLRKHPDGRWLFTLSDGAVLPPCTVVTRYRHSVVVGLLKGMHPTERLVIAGYGKLRREPYYKLQVRAEQTVLFRDVKGWAQLGQVETAALTEDDVAAIRSRLAGREGQDA